MSYKLRTPLTWSATEQDMEDAMRKWRVHDYRVDNLLPRRSRDKEAQTLEERRVILNYTSPEGAQVHLVMDRQRRAVDNFRVLYLAVDAMRLNDLRGLTDVVRAAYAQLPAPVDARLYHLVGARPDWPLVRIEEAYRAAARRVHPDQGGSEQEMSELNAAIEAIRTEKRP